MVDALPASAAGSWSSFGKGQTCSCVAGCKMEVYTSDSRGQVGEMLTPHSNKH